MKSILTLLLIPSALFGAILPPYTTPYTRQLLRATNEAAFKGLGNLGESTNFVHTTWKWVDILTSGQSLATNPSGDPPQFIAVTGQDYFGYGYFQADRTYFSIQGVHKFASTNAANPNVWFEPHVHLMVTNVPANSSNVTYVLNLYYAPVHGTYEYVTATNTHGFTNSYNHKILSFGNITNNALSGKSSVLFKGRIMRIASAANDLGASAPCFVDSLDIHMPTTELGSTGQNGD